MSLRRRVGSRSASHTHYRRFYFRAKTEQDAGHFLGRRFRGSCANRIVGLGLQMLLKKEHMKPANFVFEILRSFIRPRGLGPQLSLLLTLRGCFNDRMAQGLAPMIRHVQLNIYIYICIPPRIWSPFGIYIGHSREEFWEARGGLNALLGVVGSCGVTLSPKG